MRTGDVLLGRPGTSLDRKGAYSSDGVAQAGRDLCRGDGRGRCTGRVSRRGELRTRTFAGPGADAERPRRRINRIPSACGCCAEAGPFTPCSFRRGDRRRAGLPVRHAVTDACSLAQRRTGAFAGASPGDPAAEPVTASAADARGEEAEGQGETASDAETDEDAEAEARLTRTEPARSERAGVSGPR
jgi:hypothetical protein